MMDPVDWPEPVVPVQSISDSCTPLVPEQYIQPPSRRPSPHVINNVNNIPIIDFRRLTTDGVMVEYCPATVKEISDACRDWGFFQAVNHGISHELLHRVRDVWRQFFHLPMAEKRKHSNSPINYEGYGSRLGIENKAILDWGDYYFLHILPNSLKDHSKWPSVPSSTRETVEEYGNEAVKFCRMVMRALSISLGLDVEKLEQSFGGDDGVGSCLRVNFYPKCPQPDLTLGLSPHSDPGGLTLLLADDHVQGLQFRNGDGWGTVQPLPDAFIVNVGDQIQVLSNGVYKSVEHRVIANSTFERISLAFFFNPKGDLPIGPMADLISADHPPLYRSMTFNEYRVYIRKNGPKGKSQLESFKAL